jgi:hypothetical protein
MRSLSRRLARFVWGLLTAILKAIGREPFVAPEPAPLPARRTVVDRMTCETRASLADGLTLQAAFARVASHTTGKAVLLHHGCA